MSCSGASCPVIVIDSDGEADTGLHEERFSLPIEQQAGSDQPPAGSEEVVIDDSATPRDSAHRMAAAGSDEAAGRAKKCTEAGKIGMAGGAPKTPKSEKEKRLRRFVSQPSRDVQQRLVRALQQRLYLIARRKQTALEAEEEEEEFVVLGNTGNVYEVTIGQLPRCSCPDFQKGNRCKHLLFVLMRVLKVSQDDAVLWQNALLRSEVRRVLAAGREVAGSVLAEAAVRARYSALSGGEGGEGAGKGCLERKAVEGDCAICFESLGDGGALLWCRAGCGNNLHRDCFARWAKASPASGPAAASPCPLCRTPMTLSGEAPLAAAGEDTAYRNLGAYSGVHRAAQVDGAYPEDTTSFSFDQPWKRRRGGRRWW